MRFRIWDLIAGSLVGGAWLNAEIHSGSRQAADFRRFGGGVSSALRFVGGVIRLSVGMGFFVGFS